MHRLRFAGWLLLLAACGGGGDDEAPSDRDATLPRDDGAFPPADGSAPMPDEGGGPTLPADAAVDAAAADGATEAGISDAGVADARAAVPRPADPGLITFNPCAENTRECGTIRLPLNYADPALGTVRIAVMRRRATSVRLGALLLNPGGPGTSAIDFLGEFVEDSRSPLLDHFDLVAFDPRGVGYGTSLDCHETLQTLYAVDPSPDNEPEWQSAIAAAAKFAADCGAADGALLPHLGTLNVARDMDRVREALGEAKLDYFGFSYGTSIGARYAELFPDKVGRFVLDGAVDLGLSALDLALEQAKGFERALDRYLAWCAGAAGRCAWTAGADPRAAFLAIAAAVDAAPLPTAPTGDRPLGPGEFNTAVIATFYIGELGFEPLTQGLDAAKAGDGRKLLEYVDAYLRREADGSYPNREEANNAVNCLDRKPMSVAEIRAAAARFASEAPIFGLPALTGQLVCAHWPVMGSDIVPPRAMGAPPLVVIGTVGDPATPYAWSQALAEDLASAVLLTALGDGHTAYGRGNACVDQAVHAFYFDGVVPPENGCGAAPRLRPPTPQYRLFQRMMR
jgi:pimeloyl-ACP methyl ester carboxylesterase